MTTTQKIFSFGFLIVLFWLVIFGWMRNQESDEIISPLPDEKVWCIKESELQELINQSIDEVLDATAPLEPASTPLIEMEVGSIIRNKISKYSLAYGVDEKLLDCVVFRESSYNFEAIGDNGKAHGLGQFHLQTWQWFREMMGKPTTDTRFNPDDALDTMAWAFSEGYQNHWTCYKLCTK